jgi:hypothetical protein
MGDLSVERRANEADEHYRATARDRLVERPSPGVPSRPAYSPIMVGDLRMWVYMALPGNPRRRAGVNHSSQPTGRGRRTHGSILSSETRKTGRPGIGLSHELIQHYLPRSVAA